MTDPAIAASSARLDRPKGYAPRGTSLGLVGATLLAVGVPFFVLESAAPYWENGIDRWLSSIPYVMAFGMLPMMIFLAFAYTRRRWTVWLFFHLGVLLLVGYVVALSFSLMAVLKLFPVRDQELSVMPVVGLILLLLSSPGAWFLLRALRLRYWQPGTTPDTWEQGDETPPAWSPFTPRR